MANILKSAEKDISKIITIVARHPGLDDWYIIYWFCASGQTVRTGAMKHNPAISQWRWCLIITDLSFWIWLDLL